MYCQKCRAEIPQGGMWCTSCGSQAGGVQSGGPAVVAAGLGAKKREGYRKGRMFCLSAFSAQMVAAAVNVAGYPSFAFILALLAIAAYVYGAYNWAKYKGQSPWFCLCGLLAPLALLVLVFLPDKWKNDAA